MPFKLLRNMILGQRNVIERRHVTHNLNKVPQNVMVALQADRAVDEQIEVEMRHEELLTTFPCLRGYALSKDFYDNADRLDYYHLRPPVPSKYRADVRRRLERLAQAATTPDEVDASVAMMQFLGMVPEDIQVEGSP
jgi:hypothetical protein